MRGVKGLTGVTRAMGASKEGEGKKEKMSSWWDGGTDGQTSKDSATQPIDHGRLR